MTPVPRTPAEFGAGEMLAALLGAEGLLLAAVAITVSLAASSRIGNRWVVKPWLLAAANTVILGAISVGAGFVWAHLFGGSAWPDGTDLRIGALTLALVILAPPLISLVLSINLKWR
jgi:hypothetical protein